MVSEVARSMPAPAPVVAPPDVAAADHDRQLEVELGAGLGDLAAPVARPSLASIVSSEAEEASASPDILSTTRLGLTHRRCPPSPLAAVPALRHQ